MTDHSEESFPTRLGVMKLTRKQGRVVSLVFADQPVSPSRSVLAERIQNHLSGQPQDFGDVELDLSSLSAFSRSVYEEARKLKSGQTTTYGQLAGAIGKPRGAQAVGGAMGRNPILLLIPCHRVLGSQGSLGGFSAPGGTATKELLLAAEGYGTESLWSEGEMKRAKDHLSACSKLGPVVAAVGECTLEPLYPTSPFGALARAVLYQQLATSAARAIENRVKKLGSQPFPTPLELQNLSHETLREAGVSGPKIATLKRLAQATLRGELRPDRLYLSPNSRVEAEVSKIKGLGAWSARMFLLFHLGRRDIFPVKDLGIRKGVQALFSLDALPAPGYMERKARQWAPYRSLASWYLWRSLEL